MTPSSPDPRYLHARDVAVEAAHAAGLVIRRHAGRVRPGQVREKGLHDLVTVVDEEAQRIIVAVLQAALPSYTVLAEEGTEIAAHAAEAEGFRWIIDPIDGTTNFTHGFPHYAVSIGLQHGEAMVVGVVLDVAKDECFTAVRGGGAFCNGRRIHVTDTDRLTDSLLATGFPYRVFDQVDTYLSVLRRFMYEARGVRRPGVASLDLAYVACGRFEGFFETGLMPWDVAAGQVLVEEAGGRVTDYRGGNTQLFGRQVLATNGALHETLLEALAPLREIYG